MCCFFLLGSTRAIAPPLQVAFFTGRALADADPTVPLGLISNNVGGTAIGGSAWLDYSSLSCTLGCHPAELWSSARALSQCGDPSYNPPFPPPYSNGPLYNGMIAPYSTAPTALVGWLWWQASAARGNGATPPFIYAFACRPRLMRRRTSETTGEHCGGSCCMTDNPSRRFHPAWYACAFPALINDWRTLLAHPEFYFAFVQARTSFVWMPYSLFGRLTALALDRGPRSLQLAPFSPGPDGWEDIRQAQLGGLSLPKVAFISAVDDGDPLSPEGPYHPRNKRG